MALDYLEICKCLAGVTTLKTMQAHVRYIIEFQWYVLDLDRERSGRDMTATTTARVVRGIRNFGSP
jgi:hypothetical protein